MHHRLAAVRDGTGEVECSVCGARWVAGYERAVVREMLNEFRRFITGSVAPHAAAHPNDKWVKRIVAQLNSTKSTLDFIASS